MKITENELDISLKNKINQFDEMKDKGTNTSTYITYENGNFTNKYINELNIGKMFSMDDIYALGDHLYKSENGYESAYDKIMTNDAISYASASLLSTLNGSTIFELDSTIINAHTYDTFFLVLESNGKIQKINRIDPSNRMSIPAVEIIRSNFVYSNFDVYSIIDFAYYNDGVLVATENNGIIYLAFSGVGHCVKIQENDVKKIQLFKDNKTLIITKSSDKNNILIYNLELDKKINIFNQLSKCNQKSLDIEIDEKNFFILGRSYSASQADNLLHFWKMDAAGVDFENMDRTIAPNNSDNIYKPKLLKHDASCVYILGLKESKLFLWEYSKENLNTAPTELNFKLQDFQYNDIKDFEMINNKFYIALKNQLLVLNNKFELLENYLLDGTTAYKSIKITKSGVYAIDGRSCSSFFIPKKKYQKITDITIDNSALSCNNIDIMVKVPGRDQILFINSETGQQFVPTFYMKLEETLHIIKLSNINYKKIIMRIGVFEEDKIEGIVIHKNRIFYK